jgi:hypothetical protein
VAVQISGAGATTAPLNVVLTFSDSKFSKQYGTFIKELLL